VERIVNDRLVFILEKENVLAQAQCGFRCHRSAVDHLISLERQIENCFVLRQQLVTVFFDLEKAYNTTWRFGILRALHGWKFRGHLGFFFSTFPKTVVSASAWETFNLCLMSKRMEFLKVLF
jgi:potassium voltage-gated channel Eag-related subfamily H protein 8